MPAAPLRVTVDYHGPFFSRNPIGQFHRNQYDVIGEVGEVAAGNARMQLQPGHGYLSGDLHDSILFRNLRASRGLSFGARGTVVAGTRGFEPVRFYARKIDKKYGYMRISAAMTRSYVASNLSRFAAKLTEGLA